ncbi:5-deoxyglucuronate isomerase [Seinonella peptonophila]|uniref:5-deoxy-glucuronate isomerase n=1 Tax=Seinonella peptonophila TaxID=112248 RepID=A0A1M5A8L4_9BACL|nr:5-deoxy-glucuronate isomerase [Seinonella peptonophila]SHF26477.1 5-deoxyglucuronate isomerase [Seinonella peptonophila]
MSNLIRKAAAYLPNVDKKSVINLTPSDANWDYIGFEVVKLQTGQSYKLDTQHQEVCVVLLCGHVSARAGNQSWEQFGNRKQIFEQTKPFALYVTTQTIVEVKALSYVELALCKAPAQGKYPTRLIHPDEVSSERRGYGNMERFIHNILPDQALAEHLLVVEVFTPNGNWSSFPPHKHDELRLPNETQLEELYYHRMTPSTGFAFQRVYTDDRSLDDSFSVEDQDIVLVPKGYHPVSATPGTELYYLNVMAGPVRQWKFTNEPNFEWLIQPSR